MNDYDELPCDDYRTAYNFCDFTEVIYDVLYKLKYWPPASTAFIKHRENLWIYCSLLRCNGMATLAERFICLLNIQGPQKCHSEILSIGLGN